MKEENLSFPNKDDPTSPINNPPIDLDTLITELHCRKWWTHSWKRKCVPRGNEVYVPLIFTWMVYVLIKIPLLLLPLSM